MNIVQYIVQNYKISTSNLNVHNNKKKSFTTCIKIPGVQLCVFISFIAAGNVQTASTY